MWFIPIIGPLVNMVTSIFTKEKDTQLEEYKTAAGSSVAVIQSTKDDPGLRFWRDLIIGSVTVWFTLVSWDTIVALHWPHLMWHVADYPPSLTWMPYAVMAFLFGTVALGARKWLK